MTAGKSDEATRARSDEATERRSDEGAEELVSIPKRLLHANQKVLAETLRLVSQSREVMLLREVTALLTELERVQAKQAPQPQRTRAPKYKRRSDEGTGAKATERRSDAATKGFFRRVSGNGAVPGTGEENEHANGS